jgi:hypothetical protein
MISERKVSPATERMRRSRERRRQGLACLIVEVKTAEIDELISRGLIREEDRRDYNAVLLGLYRHLDQTLGKQ